MLAKVIIGAKIPSNDPNLPNEPFSFIDFTGELPIGSSYDSFRIMNEIGFLNFLTRVAGEGDWIRLMYLSWGDGNPAVGFAARFEPDISNTHDLGQSLQRWRDHAHGGFLYLGDTTKREVSLPSASSTYRLSGIGELGGTGIKDNYKICRKRTAGDYKWLDIFDKFQSISILKDVAGITKSDIGTTDLEILGTGHRSKVDLTYFDRARVVFGGFNNEAVAFYCKIQYSTDQATWNNLTPEGASDGTTNEQVVIGSWGNIPTGALSDVFIRAVGRAANATADPTYKNIELQVR